MAEIFRIDEKTWRFEDGFVRFFLLEGADKAVMIDSGVNCPDALTLAKTVTGKPVMLINTHGDGDHTSGTGCFSEIHMHEADYIRCGIGERYPDTRLSAIRDGDEIELGGRPLRIIHIPGHTAGSVAILDIRNRTIYAGDTVQKGHIYMFGSKREPDSYAASLDKLIRMNGEYDQIIASHDEFLLPYDYAQKVKLAWETVKNGKVPYETIELFGNRVRSYTTEYCGFYME